MIAKTTEGRFAAEHLRGAAFWRLTFLALQGGSSVVMFSALGHTLGRHAFAATAVAQGVIVIAQSIGDFGLSQAAVTTLPARIARGDAPAAGLLAGAARLYFFAMFAGLALTLAAVVVVPAAARGPVAVSAPATAAIILVSGADGLLRAQGEFRRPLALMAASELAGFAGIPIAIISGSALWTSAAIAVAMALGAIPAARLLLGLRRASVLADTRSFARAGAPVGLSQLFNALATRADTLLAGIVSGLLAAGVFEGCWRVYQLGQYPVGGLASATAPFIANALANARTDLGLRLLRRLVLQLLGLGVAAGIVLWLLRNPISTVLAGSLGHGVADSLIPFAVVSPIAAVGVAGYYTLIGLDGQRRYVLGAIILGAAVNLAAASVLGERHGAEGVVAGAAAGQAVVGVALLARLVQAIRNFEAPGGSDARAEEREQA